MKRRCHTHTRTHTPQVQGIADGITCSAVQLQHRRMAGTSGTEEEDGYLYSVRKLS